MPGFEWGRAVFGMQFATFVAMAVFPASAKEYVAAINPDQIASSASVAFHGGKAVYLAGQLNIADLEGKPIVGNFAGQTQAALQRIKKTLEDSGAKMDDIVAMTIFVTDVRDIPRFPDAAKEFFKSAQLPATTIVAIKNLGIPGALIEIQVTAVAGDGNGR
jgi:enamine deaminase RidA (YjgF/YER057c/UK114 family)